MSTYYMMAKKARTPALSNYRIQFHSMPVKSYANVINDLLYIYQDSDDPNRQKLRMLESVALPWGLSWLLDARVKIYSRTQVNWGYLLGCLKWQGRAMWSFSISFCIDPHGISPFLNIDFHSFLFIFVHFGWIIVTSHDFSPVGFWASNLFEGKPSLLKYHNLPEVIFIDLDWFAWICSLKLPQFPSHTILHPWMISNTLPSMQVSNSTWRFFWLCDSSCLFLRVSWFSFDLEGSPRSWGMKTTCQLACFHFHHIISSM